MTCMKACFDQESCMSNHSPHDTNSQTTAAAWPSFEAVRGRGRGRGWREAGLGQLKVGNGDYEK